MSVFQWCTAASWMLLMLVPWCVKILRARGLKTIPPAPTLSSVSYTPYSSKVSTDSRRGATIGGITRELIKVRRYLSHIRTYSVSGAQAWVPRIAESLGITVSLGIWIGPDEKENAVEIARAAALIRRHKNIVRVIVGNETLFRHDVSVERLKKYITDVRMNTTVPVTTAELWHTWLSCPSLAELVDEITIHTLPFWEGIEVQQAVSHTMNAVLEVCSAFPEHKVYVGEVGWPSGGHALNSLPADEYQQAEYLRSMVVQFDRLGIDYNVIEAFDQHWKRTEGTVGPHWGLFKSNGSPKWVLAGGTSIPFEGRRAFLYGFFRSSLGKVLLAITGFATFSCLVEQVWHLLSPLPISLGVGAALVWAGWCGGAAAILMHETFERYLMPREPRPLAHREITERAAYKVAIHIACRNEPPDMVNDTLSRISGLNYGNYEVHVIDNNTERSMMWRPIQEHCRELGARFNFWHVDGLAGYKGGALNYLLDKTSADVDIIAVVDSDYRVEEDWLGLVFFFHEADIAVVQCPQDYSDKWSLFKKCCYYEYKSFFNTGMIIRNSYNAIILHGTMTLIRASVLKRLRWSEQCVCEDAELGLRVLQDGHRMKYVPVSYGKGLMPDNFNDYKRQRFRWARGAVQILIRHARALFLENSGLRVAQRYQFVMGWMHWISQAGALLMNAGLVVWSIVPLSGAASQPAYSLLVSSSMIAAFLVTLLVQMLFYVRYSPDGIRNAWMSVLAGQALNHTVALAVLYSVWSKSNVFSVTPKRALDSSFRGWLNSSGGEALFFLSLWGSALLVTCSTPLTMASLLWSGMLILRSVPYATSLLMGYLSMSQPRYGTSTGEQVKAAQGRAPTARS